MATCFIVFSLFVAIICAVCNKVSCTNYTTARHIVELSFEAEKYNPRIGRLNVKYTHQENGMRDVMVLTNCQYLRIIFDPGEKFTVPKGQTLSIHYLLAPSESNLISHPEIGHFTCHLMFWHNGYENSLELYMQDIKIYPDGTFLKPCKHSNDRYLEVNALMKKNSLEFNFHHLGPITAYLSNISCEPPLKTFHHSGIWNILKDDETTSQRFPKACTGALGIDYHGNCTIDVYHMCQNSSLVKRVEFVYSEGDVDKCADDQLKQLTTKEHQHSILYSDGLIFGLSIVCGIFVKAILSVVTYKWIKFCKSAGLSNGTKHLLTELSIAFFYHEQIEQQSILDYHIIPPNWK